MADITKNCEISLSELPREKLASVTYKIKVPNFFTLPEYDNAEYEISSPSFKFACAHWQFLFKPVIYEGDEKTFRVFLKRLNSERREHIIMNSILLLNAGDTTYGYGYNLNHYYGDGLDVGRMHGFGNKDPSYDRRDILSLIIRLISVELYEISMVQELLPVGGMADKTKNCEISLSELPREKLASVKYMIKVPNFFTLPEYDNTDEYEISSPSFKFACANWQFLFKPLIFKYAKDVFKSFCVLLKRINSERQEHKIMNTILLHDANDKQYAAQTYIYSYGKDYPDEKLLNFFNKTYSFDRRDVLTLITLLIDVELPEVNMAQELLFNGEITDRREDYEVTLSELPRKRLSSVNYMMKVPNFFTLIEDDDSEFKINGPSFQFANASWQFRLEPKEMQESNITTSKEFGVFLMRLNSEVQKHSITYIISLLNGIDENYDEYRNGHIYDETVSSYRMCTFNNEKLSYVKRDTLTLSVYLICDESTEGSKVQDPLSAIRGKYLRQDFKDVLLNGENHNITFSVQGKEFLAHHDILQARSEVFHSMLTHDMLEKNNGIINVPDCDPEAFEQLLLYIYTGKAESIDEDNMFGLYYAADKYSMSCLKEECGEFIINSLSVTNVCEVIDLASKHSDANMLDSAVNYFMVNAENIFLTVKWQLFMKENPTVANELIIKSFKTLKFKTSS